jgi:hypothetical protein
VVNISESSPSSLIARHSHIYTLLVVQRVYILNSIQSYVKHNTTPTFSTVPCFCYGSMGTGHSQEPSLQSCLQIDGILVASKIAAEGGEGLSLELAVNGS